MIMLVGPTSFTFSNIKFFLRIITKTNKELCKYPLKPHFRTLSHGVLMVFA